MKNRNQNHSDNWATPKELYERLNAEFNFDFDPCPINGTDGLEIEWGKRNFINPPYSRKLKEAFVKKAVGEMQDGKICVCLLPVSTSTKLFHHWIKPNAKEIRFLEGRVRFAGVNTKGKYVTDKAPMHDSMVVVFDGLTTKQKVSNGIKRIVVRNIYEYHPNCTCTFSATGERWSICKYHGSE